MIIKSNKKTASDIVILSDDENEGSVNEVSINFENGQSQICSESPSAKTDYSITIPDGQNEILTNNYKINESELNNIKMVEVEENKESNGIIIDENSSGDSSGKENKSENKLPKTELIDPTTSAVTPIQDKLLENFLKVCEENITNSQYEHLKHKQFLILRKYYNKCGAKLSESSNFVKLMEENTNRARKSAATAVISFNEIFQYVKEVVDTESIEVSEDHRIKLKKLEKTIKLLLLKIKHLENSELNFDAEEDSSYMQLDRYFTFYIYLFEI